MMLKPKPTTKHRCLLVLVRWCVVVVVFGTPACGGAWSSNDRPQKPVNLTHFEWYNKDAFHFTWDLGVPAYKAPGQQNPNIPQTVVTAEYSYAGEGWTNCTAHSGSDGQTSCRVLKNDAFGRNGVSLRVNVTNRVHNDTETAIFSVSKISDHLKPAPADDLEVAALNSSCVKLIWRSSRASMEAQLMYSSIPLYTRTEEVPASEDGGYEHVTCGLHPAYIYNIEVRIKPKIGGYSSEPSNISLQMPEDVPTSAPRVSRSGYQRSHCSWDRERGERIGELIVYFQPVPQESQNGKIVNYTAQFGTNVTTTQSASHGLYFSRWVSCDRGLNVTLYASGALMLQSPPSEQLYIPPLDEVEWLLKEVRDMDLLVGKSETHATATWTAPAVDAWNNTLLLYYCYSSPESICKDDIHYVEVNTAEGRHSLQATGNRKFEATARFGLAATTPDNRGSGIAYTMCIYSLMKENAEPEPITLTATASLTSIHLNLPKPCDGSRVIWNYVIGYCSVRRRGDGVCNSDIKLIEVSGKTTNGYSLQDVEQGKMYMITVQANTSSSASLSSLYQPAYAQLLVYSLSPGELAGVCISVLLVVLSLGCLVSCAVRRRCREAKEKMNTTNDPPVKRPPVKPGPTTRKQNENGGGTERNVSVPAKKTPLLPSPRVPLGDRERLLNGSVPIRTLPTTDDGETTRKTTIDDDETTARTPADPPCQPPVTPPGHRDRPVSVKPEKSTATPSPCNTLILNADGNVGKKQTTFGIACDTVSETQASRSKAVNAHSEYVRSTVNHGSSDGIAAQPKTEPSVTKPVDNDPLVRATTSTTDEKYFNTSCKPESSSYVDMTRLATPPEGLTEEKEDPLAVEQDDKGEDTNKHKNAKAETEGLNREWENTLGPRDIFIEDFDKDRSFPTRHGVEDHVGDRTTSKNVKTSLLIEPNGLGIKNIFNRHLGNGGCLFERAKDINYGARKQNTHYLSNGFSPQPAGLRFSTAELDTDRRDIKEEGHSELSGDDATNLCKDLPTRCKQNTCYLPNGCLQGSPSRRLEDLSDRSDWQNDDDRGNDNDYGNDSNHDEVERKSASMQRTSPYIFHTQVDIDYKQMMAKYTTDTHVVSQDVLTKQMTFQNKPPGQKTQATARGPYVDADDRLSTLQFVRSDSGYHSLAGRQLSVSEPTSP